MAGYIGNIPTPQATQSRQSFTATASQTTFATIGYTPNYVDVYLNGVHLLDGTDYTATNSSDVVLAVGCAAGDVLEVVSYTTFEVANVTGGDNFTVTGSFTSQGIDDNATSTAMTLDSAGNLLVGKTTQDFGATGGLEFYGASGDSLTILSRASNAPLQVRRNTTDGDIVKFQKNGGVTVGSIGNISSNLYVGNADTGLGFSASSNTLYPISVAAGAIRDAGIDLGISAARFKDLYLSGGAYLGGTGAANKLDDYEEGTWTATSGSAGSLTVTYGAYYTKVGNTVTLHLNGASFSDITSTGNSLKINGLPFTAGSAYAVGHTLIRYRDDDVALICFISGGGTQIRFYKSSTTGSFIELNHTIFNSSSNSMFLSITYQTT